MLAPELISRSRQSVNQGRFREARRLAERALDVAATDHDQAMALIVCAHVESEFGNLQVAQQHLEDARLLDVTTPTINAYLLGQEAFIKARAGDFETTPALFARAIAALPTESPERASYLLDSGMVRLQTGDYVGAAADFVDAAEAFDSLGEAVAHAQALHNLGYVRMRLGDLAAATALMAQAATVLDDLSPAILAINLQDRAEVLLRAGLAQEALPELERASAILGRQRLPQAQGECQLIAARASLFYDQRRSRVLSQRAARNFRRHGSTAWEWRALATGLMASTSTRSPTRWLRKADTVATALREHRMHHEAQILDLNAALVAIDAGDLPTARFLLHRGRTTARDSLTEKLLECRAKSALSLAQGRRTAAFASLRRGLGLLHDWQASFGSLDLISSVVGHGRELATTGLQTALADPSIPLLFEWSERARALTSRVVPVRPPKDEQAAADLVEIRSLTVTEPEAGTRESRRLTELRDRVRQRAWQGTGSGEVNRIADLEEMVDALGSDTALVSYLWDGRDRLHALVVTETSPAVIDLGSSQTLAGMLGGLRADLDVSASELGDAMARVVRAGRDRRLAEVAGVLVEPLLPVIGDRRVVLTQAGILAGMPWSMLPGLIGRHLTVAATATSWLATRDLPTPVGVGFVAGPAVPRAVEEVMQSASRWPSTTVLVDGDATTERVVELAGRVDVLHISAHGKHSAEHPLFSGVLLADGPLFGYDLDQLTDVPDVVILSACEVGRSTQRWAEESLGMVNAWLHAGARCVIASAAAVADDEACEVLQDVHRLMAAGTAPGIALAEATADRPTSFVCFGAGW